MLNKKFIIIMFFIMLCSCDRSNGQFAYKSMEMDMYRKFNSGMEFNSEDRISWIYKIRNVPDEMKMGVVLLNKELTWIEIDKYVYAVKPFQSNVYGEFQNLPAGLYKIILLRNNFEIGSVEFKVYTEE